MSDLQCPATLLVARHGDADYPHAKVLSDDGGWLTETGVAQVRDLAGSLVAEERVYTAPMPELDRKSLHFASANLQRMRSPEGKARR